MLAILENSNDIATARIAAEHGDFNRIRQVAPACIMHTWFN